MNKQKLIKTIRELAVDCSGPRPMIDKLITLDLVKQLDEPQPVKVKQFVADWYENNKDYLEYNFQDWLKHLSEFRLSKNEQFGKWVNEPENNPAETLVKMKLFGYEVEEEKRYRISMPKARNHKNHAQILCEKDGKIFWCGEWYPFRTKFTRKELEEAGFGWVFSCEGIEVEEVE